MGKRTLAPMLKVATSIGPTSRSIVATSAAISSSLRASEPKAARLAALALDAGHEGSQPIGIAAGDACGEALAREPAGNGAAGGVAGADDEGSFCLSHGSLRWKGVIVSADPCAGNSYACGHTCSGGAGASLLAPFPTQIR